MLDVLNSELNERTLRARLALGSSIAPPPRTFSSPVASHANETRPILLIRHSPFRTLQSTVRWSGAQVLLSANYPKLLSRFVKHLWQDQSQQCVCVIHISMQVLYFVARLNRVEPFQGKEGSENLIYKSFEKRFCNRNSMYVTFLLQSIKLLE